MNRNPTASAPTDAALVSQARRGDHHAYRTLVARHLEAVRLAVTLLGGPPALVRTTFDVAHGCLVRGTGRADAVRPFVLQLAHHLLHAPVPQEDLLRGESCTCTPFREAGGSGHPAVAVEVSCLPPSWQAVLWHRLVEEDDDEAVARVVAVPPGKVPWLVEGALDTLRRNLVARHRKGSAPQCLGYGLRLERADGGVPRPVLRHAHSCPRCSRLLDDLGAVDTVLPRVMAEALLGPAGLRYLAVRAGSEAVAPHHNGSS